MIRLLAIVTLLAAPAMSRAANETVPIDTSTTISFDAGTKTIAASSTLAYEIADGATLTFARTGTAENALIRPAGNNNTFVTLEIGPSGPDGTGRLLVQNIAGSGNGTFFTLASNNANGMLKITNADFKNNHATGFGGVIMVNNASSPITLKNVLFENNYTENTGGGGAIRTSGTIFITSGTFLGNYSPGPMGALGLQGTGAAGVLDGVHFENNRAGVNGGAVSTVAGVRDVMLTASNVTFKDNWAAGNGGAVFNSLNDGFSMTFHLTAAGGNYYEYTGNYAAGGATVTLADLAGPAAGTPLVATASAGGFYYANSAGTLGFNIDAGVTLAIGGGAAANRAHDSIASSGTAARLLKTGAGDLVLNADNSYFLGDVAINQGRVILGRDDARLGGAITIASGATLAGAGTLTTTGTFAGLVSSVTADGGTIIQIGADGATAAQSLTLDGNLNLGDGAILRFDLFSGGASDRFLVSGAVTQTGGTSIIDINSLVAGTYNLGGIKDLKDTAKITIAGVEQVAGARQTATLGVSGDDLTLTAGADISRALTWNAASGTWNTAADNWTGSDSVTKFAPGDRVIFNHGADTTITLAGAAGIKIADMTVDSAANLTFDGAAGLAADPGNVILNDDSDPDRITDATGRLVKTGAGVLTFSNSGANTFKGGIALGGGTLAFTRAAQIDTTGAGIQVIGDAALRADAGIAAPAALANAIAIDAGRTLILDTQAHDVTHTGALSSTGTFAKTGAGTLTLAGDSGAFAGATQVNAGRLTLDNARLGGALALAPGATLAGAGTAGGGAVNAAAGAVIDIGLSAAASGTLAFGGTLTLDTATLKFDLFGLQNGACVSDRITAGGLTLVNTSTVQIGAFQTGTYTLAVIAGLDGVASLSTGLSLLIENSGRQSGALTVADTDKLILTTMADISRELAWTGAAAEWTNDGAWSGGGGAGQYAGGDRVRFGHTAAAGSRTVAVTGAVHVSDMLVSEDGYTFTGGGGITGGTRYISNSGAAEFGDTAAGKLVKTGAGALAFANTGGNLFEGGIDIGDDAGSGGVIVFNDVNQLRVGAGATISFVNTGTLRAAGAAVTGTLAAGIFIAPGKTAVLDTQGGTLAHAGALTGGAGAVFAQGGPGDTLLLSGNSPAYEGSIEVTGAMLLAGGTLGGAVNVAPGATFGGRG
ncbi:MAG: autotransporter-associated beta strand repeat-containing protein, partial [Opitutaceae bacterium]|nr:autotransporter-associated beta strand repeat-containing protein [Opitutaceae bacterium]